MARKISVIQAQILSDLQTNYGTVKSDPFYYVFHDVNDVLITPSRTNKVVLITFIVASAIGIFEQIQDVFKDALEADIAKAPPSTPIWIQDKVFKFQYPGVAKLVGFNVSYDVVDPTLRIVTQCSVTTNPNKVVQVKVASNSTPLSAPQQLALSSYLNMLNMAGVIFNLVSIDPDYIMMGYDIFYDGQYSDVIEDSVTDAITTFLNTSNENNFNSIISLSAIEQMLLAVPGVKDVVAKQVEVSPTTYGTNFKMVDDYDVLLRNYQPEAGYLIVDTRGGRTLADTLTFTVQ